MVTMTHDDAIAFPMVKESLYSIASMLEMAQENAITFLLESTWTTGQVLTVDGGLSGVKVSRWVLPIGSAPPAAAPSPREEGDPDEVLPDLGTTPH